MTLEQLQNLCDASVKAIEKIVPECKGRIIMTAISDCDGRHGEGSYMYPNSDYQLSKCFINLYDSHTHNIALKTIAHELVHSLLYRFDHFKAVVAPLLITGASSAVDVLHYQTSENFAQMIAPVIYYYLKKEVK